MRFIRLTALALAALWAAAPAHAQGIRPDRYQACSADANTKSLQGAARKTFMTQCLGLSNHTGTLVPVAQQQRLRVCNLQAADLKLSPETRGAFMVKCMGQR
jgi:hypothetical protein